MARQAVLLLREKAVADVPVENPGSFVSEINLQVTALLGIVAPGDVLSATNRVVR